MTPEEISKTAELIEKATGSKKHPYLLKRFNPTDCSDERLKTVEALQQNDLFQYRTAARRYMVLAEIEKQ